MLRRSRHRRCSQGSSHPVVTWAASPQRDQSCSGTGSEQRGNVGQQCTRWTASAKCLMEKLTIDVLTNHLELHIESKSVSASCIRFYQAKQSRPG